MPIVDRLIYGPGFSSPPDQRKDAEQKLQEADTLAEQEAAQKVVDGAEKEVEELAATLNVTPIHQTFSYQIQQFFTNFVSSFFNLFTTQTEGFTNIKHIIPNINFGPIIFYLIIFIIIPFSMFYGLK